MSAVPRGSSDRLDFRLSPEHKSLIERAASLRGQTVSSFASTVLIKAADEVVQNETTRALSTRDSKRFLAMLASDEQPNATLKAAAKRYKASRGR